MTYRIRFYILLMLALAIAVPAPSQTPGGVDILLAKARSLELRGRIDLAAENWHKVLLVNPNQTEALGGLARAAKENGRLDEERSYLDRLRKANPRDPQIAAVERLHVLTPDERGKLDQAGRLAMQHKPDDAMKIYRTVFGDQQPPPGKWSQPFYETEAASTGGREKAIAQLRQLCAQNPNQEAYRLWLASLLTYEQKTRMEGLEMLESIKDPGTVEQARAPWRQALLWEKQNPEVLAPMEAYLQHYPDPDLQPTVAALRAKQQQNIADADKAMAFKELRNKDVEAAAARFSDVLRKSPNDANATIGLAYARLDEKRFSEALSLFDRARTLAPQRQDAREGYDNARFWLAVERGATAQKANQPDAAIAAYQEALSMRPLDNGALLGIANALVRERKFSEAEAKFQQVLKQSPNNADAMAGLGFVRLNQGRFDDATRLLANAHKLDPSRKDVDQGYSNAKFWGVMSQAASALKQDHLKEAVTAYEQALQLNPNNRDALIGLANASMRAGDFPAAAKTYYRLAAANPTDQGVWLGLIKAQLGEKAPQAAMSTLQQIPPAVKQQMESHSDYLSELAMVYYEANQPALGEQFLRRALATAGQSDSDDALSVRLQIAGAFMEQGKTGQAIQIYREATQSHPANPSGWEGLVGAYTRLGNFPQAITTVRTMPKASYDAAVKHTGFLDSVAVLYSTQGQCAEAEDFLHRSLAMDQSDGRQPAESTQMQLADIWMREHNYNHARDLYSDIVVKNPNSADAWRGYLVVLHQQQADRTLVGEVPHMPSPVRKQLEADPNFLILEASAFSTSGRNPDALQLLQQARSTYTAQRHLPPVVLDMQTAWTMLAVSTDAPGLSDLLLYDKRRTDLTPKQREAFEEIFSDWSVRRADRAFETKPELGFSILEDASHEYPGDRNIHAALASLYLKRHDKQKALEIFQSWGMTGAQAGDYRVAAGAALSAHKFDLADEYLRRGLTQFPHDPELIHMNAREDIARGNYDEGEQELRSALVAMREESTSAPAARAAATNSAASAPVDPSAAVHNHADEMTMPCRSEASRGAPNEARIRPIGLIIHGSHVHPSLLSSDYQEPQPQQPQPQQPAQPEQQPQPQQTQQAQPPQQQTPGTQQQQSPPQSQQPAQREQRVADEVEAVDNRNTPMVVTGAVGTGRIGDPGLDQLIIVDSLLGSAYTATNRVRLGVEGHGVFAFSGTPDGSSTLMFGTLPAGALFGEQSKTGYSGLAQLSTNTFGIAAGTSPQGFAVHNLIGGIRYRPLNGWLTVQGVRDSVKDSLLSYAGARDPGTGLRWGGVVANTGTVRFDSGPSSNVRYKTIGEYASGSYSFIQGLHVPDNWSATANGGLYWQIVQGLTVGANANVMHYDKNLKYFSFGQGGYFSPQEYYLASIPISWYSRHPRFEYQVKFSGGVQYLHESASVFYPASPGSANVTQGLYGSDNSAAPNYDADIRMGYRVAPHMYLDTFATANNARNYYTQSVGFSLKFTTDRIPTSTDLRVNSIPDWTGKQPFSVH
ncbi:MAG TPA: cellulose synthase subunit BcsC-related outer membrane protein [Terracidiphilus sp.]|jgi:tetratricopeptide (TPR) repeat protein